MNDLDLRQVLDAAITDEPAPHRSPADVFARAGRIRSVRTTGVWAGAATVAAVLVASVAVAGSGHGGTASAPAGPASPVGKPTSLPSAVEPGPSTPPPIAGATILANLRSLLPAGTHVVSADGHGYNSASVVLGDAQGKVLLVMDLEMNPLAGEPAVVQEIFSCATRGMPAGTQCQAWTQPDGTRVIVTDGSNEDQNVPDVLQREVDALTPNGLRITLFQWNAEHEKAGPPTRRTLLLTLEQMQTIALNPAWSH